jgi:hypothetical protein
MPAVPTSGFVGVETCKVCHIPEAEGMHSNPHWKPELEGKQEAGIAPTWNAEWCFKEYNEGSPVGPTSPRDLRGNIYTPSLRYSY